MWAPLCHVIWVGDFPSELGSKLKFEGGVYRTWDKESCNFPIVLEKDRERVSKEGEVSRFRLSSRQTPATTRVFIYLPFFTENFSNNISTTFVNSVPLFVYN